MIKRSANIILEGLNLEVSRDCGRKAGHVVEGPGMNWGALWVFIGGIPKMHKLGNV